MMKHASRAAGGTHLCGIISDDFSQTLTNKSKNYLNICLRALGLKKEKSRMTQIRFFFFL